MACKAPITSTGAFRAKLDKLLKGLRAKTAKDRAAARKYALDLLSQPNGELSCFLDWLWNHFENKIMDYGVIFQLSSVINDKTIENNDRVSVYVIGCDCFSCSSYFFRVVSSFYFILF